MQTDSVLYDLELYTWNLRIHHGGWIIMITLWCTAIDFICRMLWM